MSRWKRACAIFLLCSATAAFSPAQLSTIASFDGTNGAGPGYEFLIQGTDGSFYGTTTFGGSNCSPGCGVVFKITAAGTLTTLHSFCTEANCADGASPYGGLVQAGDGNFYGTTYGGGANFSGTVFRISPQGTLSTIYSFCAQPNCTDGLSPFAGLTLGTDGNLYGTTYGGGADFGGGTVFKITPSGTLTTIHSFCSQGNCFDGNAPLAGLVEATDGNFYGTTGGNGTPGLMTVFKITPSGTLTTLYSFCAQYGCPDGILPMGLIQATDGNFYGTTGYGGASGYGTIFKIRPGGKLTTLYNFCLISCADGATPLAGLVQGTDKNFYGTTASGGAYTGRCGFPGCGVLFKMTPEGALTNLHNFCPITCGDGENPLGGVLQATDGTFYGATSGGGTFSDGLVFSFGAGLGPFVETLPNSGKVGQSVGILGNHLTGATSVTFNGTAAAFTVVSSSEIRTTVPPAATSGKVKVTTPQRTLLSNVVFRVRP